MLQEYDFLRTANIKGISLKGYSLVPALLPQVCLSRCIIPLSFHGLAPLLVLLLGVMIATRKL